MNDSLPGFLPKPPRQADQEQVEVVTGVDMASGKDVSCINGVRDEPSETEAELARPLYDISHDWAVIVDHLVEAGGEMTPENLAMWDGIQGEASHKLESCAMMIQTLTSQRDAIKVEAKRMTDRAKVAANKVDGLKRYAQTHMETMGMKRAEGVSVSMRIQGAAASCDVIDIDQVPVHLVAVTVKMSGHDWAKIQARLIDDGYSDDDWTVAPVVDKKAVVALWKESHESEQTPGTVVSKGKSLRLC